MACRSTVSAIDSLPTGFAIEEDLGRRISMHRAKRDWTQQQLADRLAISRTAVSHLESGLSVPGERTVALLAGVFGMEPHDLVAGSTYPRAKAERLPVVVARYTEVEHQLAMFERDLRWLDRAGPDLAEPIRHEWHARLVALAGQAHDPEERAMLADAHRRLRANG